MYTSSLGVLFEFVRNADQLAEYIDREFLVADLKALCIHLNINKYHTVKFALAKRIASFIHEFIEPYFKDILATKGEDEYVRRKEELVEYLEQKMKNSNVDLPTPSILQNIPQEYKSGAKRKTTKSPKIVIPDISDLPEVEPENIKYEPLALVEEAQPIEMDIFQEQTKPIEAEIVEIPSVEEVNIVEAESLNELPLEVDQQPLEVDQQPLPDEPVLEDEDEKVPLFTQTLEMTYRQFANLYFIDILTKQKETPSMKPTLPSFKQYLKDQGVILPVKEMMKTVYDAVKSEIKPEEDPLSYLYSLLPGSPKASPRRERSPSPLRIDREEIVQMFQEPQVNEVPVESGPACYVRNTHSSLDDLADDLTCPSGQVCDVVEQQCIETSEASEITTLQIGNRIVSVAGKSKDDIVNDIKMEVLTLSYQIKEKKLQEQQQTKKKYQSTPIDLDQLWNRLKSVQSSQLLYTQKKVELANKQLRDQIQKCLFR